MVVGDGHFLCVSEQEHIRKVYLPLSVWCQCFFGGDVEEVQKTSATFFTSATIYLGLSGNFGDKKSCSWRSVGLNSMKILSPIIWLRQQYWLRSFSQNRFLVSRIDSSIQNRFYYIKSILFYYQNRFYFIRIESILSSSYVSTVGTRSLKIESILFYQNQIDSIRIDSIRIDSIIDKIESMESILLESILEYSKKECFSHMKVKRNNNWRATNYSSKKMGPAIFSRRAFE